MLLKAPGSWDDGGMPCGTSACGQVGSPPVMPGAGPRHGCSAARISRCSVNHPDHGKDGGGEEEEPQVMIYFIKALALCLGVSMDPHGNL